TLENGDILEITVAGAPALQGRVTISDEGKLSLPFLGYVDAKGHSLSELQQELGVLLVERNKVGRPSISVKLVEHRPIYVGGDVSKPGEYRYSPEMTIRTAVTLAGGCDLLKLETRPPPSEIPEARGQAAAAAIELVRNTARAARIRAQLANQKKLVADAK